MSNNINIKIKTSAPNVSGLRRSTVRMLNSDWGHLNTNEVPLLLHAVKYSRYPDSDLLYSLDFREEEETWYDPDNFHGTLTLMCKYGVDDITESLDDVDIMWERYSLDTLGNERTQSDALWNLQHDFNHWSRNRMVLNMQHSDLNAETGFPSLVRFTAKVRINDGRGDSNIYSVEYEIN